MKNKLTIEPGQKFGKLTVQFEAAPLYLPSGQINRAFMCKCDCGNEKVVRLVHLNHGRINSCGCLITKQQNLSRGRIYKVWAGMKVRTGLNHHERHLYADRGIDMCKEWRNSYLEFHKWAMKSGWREGLTIDRIDNDKGYSPENCRWVTPSANARNKRDTFHVFYRGEHRGFMDLLDEKGLADHCGTIRSRIIRGWTADAAIDTPIRQGNYRRKVAA